MNHLPIEIVNLILEYQGYHSYRNGKYVNKLHIHNDVIQLLMNLKKIKKNIYGTYEVCFWKKVPIPTNSLVENSIFPFPKNNICKDIIFIIETHDVGSQVLWVMNVAKHYDDDSYEDLRTQFILHR